MSTLRPVEPMVLPDVTRSALNLANRPAFEWIDPRSLLVDETYQRNLSERSVRLIRRIVSGWDWTAFKPPICTRTESGLHVIDGQHTAIAAASSPDIPEIPVMIVEASEVKDRAVAFVKHNRDRLAVTPTQIHFAMVAAGDEDALTIEKVCERAGARVVKTVPYNGRWRVGDTMAIAFLNGLVNRRHAAGARAVVEICVKGQLAPVTANYLHAVEELLHGQSYAGQVDPEAIVDTIVRMGPQAEKEAAHTAISHKLPLWKALAVVLFRNTRKVRRGRDAAA